MGLINELEALRGKNVEFPEEEGILKLTDLRDIFSSIGRIW